MDLTKLFEAIKSDVLTDEVKFEMSSIFEENLNEAIKAKEAELEAENELKMTEFKAEMTENLDKYLNYFVEEIVKENKTAIEGITVDNMAKGILENFQNFVDGFNINLSKESVVESIELKKAKDTINLLISKIETLKTENQAMVKKSLIEKISSGIEIETDRESFRAITENINFDDEVSYEGKLKSVAKRFEKTQEKIDFEKKPEPEADENKVEKTYLRYL